MIQPELLREGDVVGILATARKISKEEVQPAIDLFKSWGLKVELGPNLFAEHHQYAGTDEQRASDLQQFLDDDNIRAIVCARGGYGSTRIMEKVNFLPLERNPKWIVGYSDITMLHSRIHNVSYIETLHSTMPINFPTDGSENEATQSLKRALFEGTSEDHIEPHSLNRFGDTRALLVGGNLSILYGLLECEASIDTEGKILFLEDIDEYLYHVDRMMIALKRAGKLEGLVGLVVGGMTDMNDNAIPFGKSAEEIIAEHVAEFDYPVAFGVHAGHVDKNCALILGRHYVLEVSESGTILKT